MLGHSVLFLAFSSLLVFKFIGQLQGQKIGEEEGEDGKEKREHSGSPAAPSLPKVPFGGVGRGVHASVPHGGAGHLAYSDRGSLTYVRNQVPVCLAL